MTALVALLVVLSVSLLVTKVATIALVYTGLSRQSARFQARSAFTGVGFTTREAEAVVSHPVRRKIVLLLMLLGNAGFVSMLASLVLTFVGSTGIPSRLLRLGVLAVGLGLLYLLSVSRPVDRWLSWLIRWALARWTRLDVRDYAAVLHLAGEYRVVELEVTAEDWLAGRTLASLRLDEEGVLVLGIECRGDGYLGAPRGRTVVHAGDRLLLYGRSSSLDDLDERRSGSGGERAHERAVREQKRVEEEAATEAERGERQTTGAEAG